MLFPSRGWSGELPGSSAPLSGCCVDGALEPDHHLPELSPPDRLAGGRYLDLALENRLQELGAPLLGRLCGLSGSMPYKGMYRDLAHSPTGFMRHYVGVHGRAHEVKSAPVDEPEELPRLSELIKSSLPRPAVMVMLLRRLFSGATLGWSRPSQSLPKTARGGNSSLSEDVCQAVDKDAKVALQKLPRPPRTRSDQREYFRILGHAVDSAAKPQNRPALIAVAEALIQHTGPRTGQIYFGTKGRDVELIMQGLVLLGIDVPQMTLVVRGLAEVPGR